MTGTGCIVCDVHTAASYIDDDGVTVAMCPNCQQQTFPGRSDLSLLCRIQQDRAHRPCSGTTDDGTDSPCSCLCHAPGAAPTDLTGARALTIIQPWATLIAHGHKHIETRSWNTNHRGPVLIHAAKSMPCKVGETLHLGRWSVERDGMGARTGLLLRPPIGHPYRLPLGAIVAVANLIDVRPVEAVPLLHPQERAFGDYTTGRYAWFLDDVVPLHAPVHNVNGMLGLWTPTVEHLAAVHAAMPVDDPEHDPARATIGT